MVTKCKHKKCVSEKVSFSLRYFDSIVREFMNMDDKPILRNCGRNIYMTQRAKDRLKNAFNIKPKAHLEKMIRSDLTVAIMEWMKTRVSYDATKKHPTQNMVNWFVWQEVGTVHIYLIFMGEALYDVVPANHNEEVIHWSKCAGRFIDATCYPDIKCYFDIKTEENVYFASDSAVLNNMSGRISELFGDIQKQQDNIEYKSYGGELEYGHYREVKLIDRQEPLADLIKDTT